MGPALSPKIPKEGTMRHLRVLIGLLAFSLPVFSVGGPVPPDVTDDIAAMVQDVSRDNVRAILEKLASFTTRHVLSSDKEGFGIRASAGWLHAQFSALSPRLQVSFDAYDLPAQGGRLSRDVTLRNVVAVLPGRHSGDKERIFLVNAHYDSLARPGEGHPRDGFDHPAPGVNDDGSGIAALLEMARVLSRGEFDATIHFVAFSGEEVGLVGSTLMAARMKKEGRRIDGVITLDMIGNVRGGDGFVDNRRLRVFSDGPEDSPSRQLARYAKRVGERYFPSAEIDCVFRADRFGRGGDHTPFVLEGWPGIRMMEARENYSRQHTADDTLENMDLDYCTRNIRITAAVLASLAAAPPAPDVRGERGQPLLGRGPSGYDAQLRWNAVPRDGLAGYKVYWRRTSAPFWENEAFVGDRTEFVLDKVTIDEYVFGVSAVDKEGRESLVSAYTMAPRRKSAYTIK
jgi:hypothetical protein